MDIVINDIGSELRFPLNAWLTRSELYKPFSRARSAASVDWETQTAFPPYAAEFMDITRAAHSRPTEETERNSRDG